MLSRDIRYGVIGAGNGGIAMAGYLSNKGYNVNLYNRTYENIKSLVKKPVIKLTGEENGYGELNIVSDDIQKVIDNVDVIMVTTPAMGHYNIAKAMAPYLEDGQVVVLNPGRTGGALEVYNVIRNYGCKKDIVVAEAQTFVYACRKIDENSAHIFKIKNEVSVSAIPSNKTNYVIDLLNDAYPQFIPAKDVIETSLNNYGAIFHPAPTLLNSGHIERGAPFDYYTEGITPSISRILEMMDMERVKIGKALNIDIVTAKDWLEYTYDAKGENLYEAIQNNSGYKGLKAPQGLKIRYIYEDVPYSLVPISSLGKQLNIKTPAIDSIIKLAELITNRNFWKEGRNIERLGLRGLNVEQIHQFAQTGTIQEKDSEVVA